MKHLLKSAAVAAIVIAAGVAPVAVQAQTLPPAVIVVVDMDQVFNSSAAGKQAQAELKAKVDAMQARATTLRTQFGAEEEALGKSQPAPTNTAARPAWEAKVRDFQSRQQTAQTELSNREKEFQASRQFVLKQITDASNPIITTLMRERGASIAMPEGATLQHSASIDVTNDLVARLDKALPRVSTTAPAGAK